MASLPRRSFKQVDPTPNAGSKLIGLRRHHYSRHSPPAAVQAIDWPLLPSGNAGHQQERALTRTGSAKIAKSLEKLARVSERIFITVVLKLAHRLDRTNINGEPDEEIVRSFV